MAIPGETNGFTWCNEHNCSLTECHHLHSVGLTPLEQKRYAKKEKAKDCEVVESLLAAVAEIRSGALKAKSCILIIVEPLEGETISLDIRRAGSENKAEFYAYLTQAHAIETQRLVGG